MFVTFWLKCHLRVNSPSFEGLVRWNVMPSELTALAADLEITVEKALSKVDGVTKTEVSFEKLEAVVTFDDAKTTVQKLTEAAEDAGYPSSVRR